MNKAPLDIPPEELTRPRHDWELANLAAHWPLLSELGRQGKLPPDYGRTPHD